jgi:integrase
MGHDFCREALETLFGKLAISKLTTDHIQRYITHRLAEGVGNGTINREFTLLRRCLNLGRMCTPPEVTRAPLIPRLAEAPPRKGFFEHEECVAMSAALPPDVRAILAFGYYTGRRRGEVMGLPWSQVDLLEGAVRLEPGETKNDEDRTFYLTPQLREVLEMQRAIREEKLPDRPLVFFWHDTGKRIVDFRGSWEAASKAAGLWDERTGRPKRIYHDSRRTGVRDLLRSGNSESVAMRISGHKTRAVFDRYNIVSDSDLKDAARHRGEYANRKQAETTIPHTPGTQDEKRGPTSDPLNPPKLLN